MKKDVIINITALASVLMVFYFTPFLWDSIAPVNLAAVTLLTKVGLSMNFAIVFVDTFQFVLGVAAYFYAIKRARYYKKEIEGAKFLVSGQEVYVLARKFFVSFSILLLLLLASSILLKETFYRISSLFI